MQENKIKLKTNCRGKRGKRMTKKISTKEIKETKFSTKRGKNFEKDEEKGQKFANIF